MPAMLKLASDPTLLDFECLRALNRNSIVILNPWPAAIFLRAVLRMLEQYFEGSIEPTLALLEELQSNTQLKIGILSNTNQTHFDKSAARISAFKTLDHVYASHEIGFRKPEREAYLYVLEKMGMLRPNARFLSTISLKI